MGRNVVDVILAIDAERKIAPVTIQIDGTQNFPSAPFPYTFAGITAQAIVVPLDVRSAKSPANFGAIRSCSFSFILNNLQVEPGDCSIWIPDTNFLARLRPLKTNTLGMNQTPVNNFDFTSVNGVLNLNATPQSIVYLVKQMDSNQGGATQPGLCFMQGVFNLQNWDVAPWIAAA